MELSFSNYVSVCLFLVSIILLGLMWFIGILPYEHLLVFAGIVLGIDTILCYFMKRKRRTSIFSTIISFVLMIVMILGIIYEINTVAFLSKIGKDGLKKIEYVVLTKAESPYEKLADLKNQKVGAINHNVKELTHMLNKKVKLELETYDDLSALEEKLLDASIEAMIIETSYQSILLEENENWRTAVKEIARFEVEMKEDAFAKSVDVTEEPFNVFISGIDSYGSIDMTSRSDVNMLVTVNPKTHTIALTSIPRDYYVEIVDHAGTNDKLTHAGIYGVDTSVKTVENLLDTSINYYVKVNFSSLEKIVDTLDGVTVQSDADFTTINGYTFQKGENKVDGAAALAFCRERKAFLTGDRARGKNHQKMIAAIIDKVISPSILIKYNELLNALSGSFKTNLKDDDIIKFVQMQIKENASWNIVNLNLDGKDAMEYTNSYRNAKSYVMIPDKKIVEEVKTKIKEVLEK